MEDTKMGEDKYLEKLTAEFLKKNDTKSDKRKRAKSEKALDGFILTGSMSKK